MNYSSRQAFFFLLLAGSSTLRGGTRSQVGVARRSSAIAAIVALRPREAGGKVIRAAKENHGDEK